MATAEALDLSESLTSFASAYENGKFIADKVAPVIEVSAMSGTFQKRARADVNRATVDDMIGTDGTANELGYSLSEDTWALVPRALKAAVNGAMNSAVVSALDPEQEAVEQLMQAIGLAHEKRVAGVLTTTTNYTSANRKTAAALWSNTVTGDPLGDIKAALRALPSAGDNFKRVMWISDVVFDALTTHPQLLALKGTTLGAVSDAELLQFFKGLDEVHVSDTTYNSANAGQSASYSRIWSATACGIALVPRTAPSTRTSIFAASFRHTSGVRVRQWMESGRGYGGSSLVQVEHLTQPAKVIQDDCGVIISSCL